jgi:RNA polymerase sigma factor (sigma-70 family)
MNMPCHTDIELWSAFKKGDDKAFTFIYSQNFDKLFFYGLKFTFNHVLVEDTIQELFSELLKKRKHLGDTDNILFYLLLSFKRKLFRKIQREQLFDYDQSMENIGFEVVWSVEQEIIQGEISAQKLNALRDAMEKLSPRQKEAIYLRFNRELAYREVGKIMGISIEACRNLISKAIAGLRSILLEE